MPRAPMPARVIKAALERLNYDPSTGVISHKVATSRGVIGRPAGNIGRNGYLFVRIRVDGKNYTTSAQRMAWILHYGREPEGIVDHEDDDKLNNRLSNLRDLTQSRNVLRGKRLNRDLPRGVTYSGHNNKTNPFAVQFKRADGTKHHSYHPTPAAAEAAFRAAFVASYGVYAEEL